MLPAEALLLFAFWAPTQLRDGGLRERGKEVEKMSGAKWTMPSESRRKTYIRVEQHGKEVLLYTRHSFARPYSKDVNGNFMTTVLYYLGMLEYKDIGGRRRRDRQAFQIGSEASTPGELV